MVNTLPWAVKHLINEDEESEPAQAPRCSTGARESWKEAIECLLVLVGLDTWIEEDSSTTSGGRGRR